MPTATSAPASCARAMNGARSLQRAALVRILQQHAEDAPASNVIASIGPTCSVDAERLGARPQRRRSSAAGSDR